MNIYNVVIAPSYHRSIEHSPPRNDGVALKVR